MSHSIRRHTHLHSAILAALCSVIAFFSLTASAHAMTKSDVGNQISRIEDQLEILEELLANLSTIVPSQPRGEVLSHQTTSNDDTNQGTNNTPDLGNDQSTITPGGMNNTPSFSDPGGGVSSGPGSTGSSGIGSGNSGIGSGDSGVGGGFSAGSNPRDSGGPERQWDGQAQNMNAYIMVNGTYKCRTQYYLGTKDLCSVPSFLQKEAKDTSTSTKIATLKKRAVILAGHIDLYIKQLDETNRRIALLERSLTASSSASSTPKVLRVTPTSGIASLTVSLQGVPSAVLTKMMECTVSKGKLGASGNGLSVNWGDGKVLPSASSTIGSNCANSVMFHTYKKPGTYTITVTSWKIASDGKRVTEWKGTTQARVTPKP